MAMYTSFFSIYDAKGSYIGFADTLKEAIAFAAKYNGTYELEFAKND
jgi:hypothetical protein